MNEEIKSLLLEIKDLSIENNKLLKKAESRARWSVAFKFVYWTAIILAGVGSFYLIQPYIDMLSKVTGSGQGTNTSMFGIPSGFDISSLKKNFEDLSK